MNALDLLATAARSHLPLLLLVAHEPTAPWAARALDEDVPPASLGDARVRRDELRGLLSRERAAAADFLLALADFDRRRGWERLGHASLFSFLTRELGLSKGAAFLRLSAARLLPRHPAVEAALRRGDLCLSAVGELARVLTPENEADVLPRYFGCSSREAREVSAALRPVPAPPVREVVTRLPVQAGAASRGTTGQPLALATPLASAPGAGALAEVNGSAQYDAVRAHEPRPAPPAPVAPRTPAVEPLTGDLRRLHLTVSKGFLDKVAATRDGLSHALPGATTEQVLEAALDLLLARQAQRKGLGKRARRAPPEARHPGAPSDPEGDGAPAGPGPMAGASPASPDANPAGRARGASTTSPPPLRPHVPTAIEREVRLRDGDRCQFPLDAGGVCGSTWQVELDHLVPFALGGPTSPANVRCACRPHNQAAAEEALGPAIMRAARGRRARKGGP
ncbi:MAG: HNH endonuclease [Anaeromyxobacter sp.]|nr:HNH endonuclease [Anaeromyxobacter sp.]MBL0277341.1 HNH endonuclease [Anaeromyxobacter sp.]